MTGVATLCSPLLPRSLPVLRLLVAAFKLLRNYRAFLRPGLDWMQSLRRFCSTFFRIPDIFRAFVRACTCAYTCLHSCNLAADSAFLTENAGQSEFAFFPYTIRQKPVRWRRQRQCAAPCIFHRFSSFLTSAVCSLNWVFFILSVASGCRAIRAERRASEIRRGGERRERKGPAVNYRALPNLKYIPLYRLIHPCDVTLFLGLAGWQTVPVGVYRRGLFARIHPAHLDIFIGALYIYVYIARY